MDAILRAISRFLELPRIVLIPNLPIVLGGKKRLNVVIHRRYGVQLVGTRSS